MTTLNGIKVKNWYIYYMENINNEFTCYDKENIIEFRDNYKTEYELEAALLRRLNLNPDKYSLIFDLDGYYRIVMLKPPFLPIYELRHYKI